MILSANQPYFMPYLGYWQLIAAADVFLIGDDYNYIKGGWISRNRILHNGEPYFFGLDIKNASSNATISDTTLLPIPKTKLLKTLQMEYGRAPYFEDGYRLMEDILSYDSLNLTDFLENSIRKVCEYLDIKTVIRRTSEFANRDSYKLQYRIFDYCRKLNADTYINPPGGKELYNKEEFEKEGIKLMFLQSSLPEYRQFGKGFVKGLSIIDIIMFNSRQQCMQMISAYELE